ncbi:FecCD family ABC transporter permease [Stutzerimonas urumqiensis]|uniref:FecCD family ABC transporter permease n=1 Tax=Stutzerimonas urumqiensis TaxID=638269 RepID=UPI000EABD653|nr:iron ABC transporter permease [Stutzerimonas urumqiensis]
MPAYAPSRPLLYFLASLLVLAFWLSLVVGPTGMALADAWRAIMHLLGAPVDLGEAQARAALIIGQIRLPRALLAVGVGAILAMTGVAMQGLFRNPLADPALIGVSSGASLGAAAAIVLLPLLGQLPAGLEPYWLSICAFLGGLAITSMVYRLGRRDGRTDVATMLLAGIALTALAGACIGLLTYLADDTALRSLMFWNLGSLGGATLPRVWPVLAVGLALVLWLPRRANALNVLLLGESEARHLGFPVEAIKRELVLCTALGVGVAVAAVGMIGFVGLIVPHLVRLATGPDHRTLLPASALAGGVLLLLADLLARVPLAPAELPIGLVTALLGAPFFLWLLARRADRC